MSVYMALDQLKTYRARREQLTDQVKRIDAQIALFVKRARSQGATVPDISGASGLSGSRIYQIINAPLEHELTGLQEEGE